MSYTKTNCMQYVPIPPTEFTGSSNASMVVGYNTNVVGSHPWVQRRCAKRLGQLEAAAPLA